MREPQPSGGLLSPIELHVREAALYGPLRRRVELALGARAEQAEVVRTQLEHLACEQGEQAGLRIRRVCQGVEQGLHDLDFDHGGEGRAPRDDALQPTGAYCVDVQVGVGGNAEKQRHVCRALPGVGVCL